MTVSPPVAADAGSAGIGRHGPPSDAKNAEKPEDFRRPK
jgi:hypothetical protein